MATETEVRVSTSGRRQDTGAKFNPFKFRRNPDQVKVNDADWYKVWEETESSRRVNYNEMEHQIDRLDSATKDFLMGRPWPSGPCSSLWGPRNSTERYLVIVPRLWRFYINYLLRNRVFPDQEHEEGFRQALQYVELAAEELPKISEISKALPDGLSKALDECFQIQTQTFRLKAKENGWNDDQNASQSADTNDRGDWNHHESPDTSPEFSPSDLSSWCSSEPDMLMKYLGPTLFPLTHTSGVVEESVRRIKSVIPPSESKCSPSSDSEVQAIQVEMELKRRFSKVVLSPWLGWEKPEGKVSAYNDQHIPRIQKLSRGKVIVEKGSMMFDGLNEKDVVIEEAAAEQPGNEPKPHDPLKDDITILLEPSTAEKFKVGMGIGALWVRIARRADLEVEALDITTVSSKTRTLKKRYWFVDGSVFAVLTSYYIV
ncbi:hypothetical protein D9758_004216 [Tetrapyrgos nigripes]|uniref:Uncharacterized protein n=1 Tax=Tetrapyrgos nigripes TaxID=182062 RepID=A0A8H5GUA2_9AGAR|nr:hypothetical protein D9758_004216 [Tetrapyrgos nigripes]